MGGVQFVELERKIKEEIKLRDKAKRKLKFLKNKLESFNMSSSSGQSYSSQKCENSCGSSSCSSTSRHSEGNETKACISNPSYEDLESDESRLILDEDDHGDFVDNSLALVPATLPATSQATSNHKPVNESVVEALDAMRRAKERLLCSIGTRPMIKVGPT